jgi:hypothetical protein
MAEELVVRKDLLRRLVNVTADDWIKAAKKLGFSITQPKGGSSHYASRNSKYPIEDFKKNFITNIYKGMNKRKDVNPKVFKSLRRHGVEEDAIWKALELI